MIHCLLTLSSLCLLAILTGCRAPAVEGYPVHSIPNASITIDGRLDEPAWALAEPLTEFTDAWQPGALPTTFKAFQDRTHFYFAFIADDTTPRFESEWKGEKTLDREDRVEIYFAKDEALQRYYCIEIDSHGRVHDFLGAHYRQWDNTWNMPGLKTAGVVGDGGYVVEGSIPLAELEALGIGPLGADRWRVGLFRADLHAGRSVHWIAWTVPTTPKSDFHTPSAFGYFKAGRTRK